MSHATTLDSIRKHAENALDGPAPPRPAAPPGATKVCPYCGHREGAQAEACSECRGLFEPLSRIATQNAMGPWQIRDESNPFRPGCSIETLRALIRRGKLTRESVLRGPTTKQFWMRAAQIQGVANLLGVCHACAHAADASEHFCRSCGASFLAGNDRNWVGLDPVRPVPQTPPAAPLASAARAGDAEPKASPAPAPMVPAPGTMPAADFADLFAAPAAPSAGRGPATREAIRESRHRANAVGHAVAAATVALCAAALSVAVWAASAAHAVGSADAAPTTPSESPAGVPGPTGPASPDAGQSAAPTTAGPTPEELEAWRVRIATAATLSQSDDIKSLEEAVVILRDVQKDAPEAVRPADLGASIESLERRIDDLTIRKFLRQDG